MDTWSVIPPPDESEPILGYRKRFSGYWVSPEVLRPFLRQAAWHRRERRRRKRRAMRRLARKHR